MLIIDDDCTSRILLAELFQDEFSILEAEGGKAGLTIVTQQKEKIDIVLLDLLMPEMSGIQFLQELRTQFPNRELPIVVISASDAVEDQLEAFRLGANDYIEKPFIPEIVTHRIQNVLTATSRMRSILQERATYQRRAEMDQMTGVFNKVTAERIISSVLHTHEQELHSLLIIDIDNFKYVNDTAGHLVGDRTIKIVANMILSLFRKSDIVGRIGGDEFIVLMRDIPSAEVARRKVADILRLLRFKPNLTLPANVSVSIGFVFNHNTKADYQELFTQADMALAMAKKAGKGRSREYGQDLFPSTSGQESVLVCTRDRRTFNVISKLLEGRYYLLSANDWTDIPQTVEEDPGTLKIACIDISEEDNASSLLEQAHSFPCLQDVKTVVLCCEGDIPQLRTAVLSGADDVMTCPLDEESFQRRVVKLLHSTIEKEDC